MWQSCVSSLSAFTSLQATVNADNNTLFVIYLKNNKETWRWLLQLQSQ